MLKKRCAASSHGPCHRLISARVNDDILLHAIPLRRQPRWSRLLDIITRQARLFRHAADAKFHARRTLILPMTRPHDHAAAIEMHDISRDTVKIITTALSGHNTISRRVKEMSAHYAPTPFDDAENAVGHKWSAQQARNISYLFRHEILRSMVTMLLASSSALLFLIKILHKSILATLATFIYSVTTMPAADVKRQKNAIGLRYICHANVSALDTLP